MKLYLVNIYGHCNDRLCDFTGSKTDAKKLVTKYIKENNKLMIEDWNQRHGDCPCPDKPLKFDESMINEINFPNTKKGILHMVNTDAREAWVSYAGGEPFSNFQ
jgi:hypothetical protein